MLSYVYRSLKRFYSGKKQKIFFYILFSLLHKASVIILPLLTQKLVDTALQHNNISDLHRYGLINLIVTLLFMCFLSGRYYLENNLNTRILNEMKHAMIESTGQIPYRNIIEKDVGYFIKRIDSDTEKIESLILSDYVNYFINIIYLLAIVFVMFRLNLYISTVLLLLFPLFILASRWFIPKIEALNNQMQELGEGISSVTEETVNGNYTLRVNNATQYILQKISHVMRTFFMVQMKEVRLNILYDFLLVTGIMNLAQMFIYWYGGVLVFAGDLSVGTLVALTLYFSRLWSPVEFFMEFPKKLAVSKVSLDRINDLINENIPSVENTPLPPFEELTFDHVSFSFRERSILKDFSLTIRKGDKIGIGGENGSGKSTIANLCVKLFAPDSGQIKYNGNDLSELPDRSVRDRIVLIPSDSFLFKASIEENISLNTSVHRLHNDYLNRLTNSFAEKGILLTEELDNKGQNLSGGEKKLIQLARGLQRRGDIYILDEPLNFVDQNFKKMIIEFIRNSFRDKTLVIISHDRDAFALCNREYRLQDGRLHAKPPGKKSE